MVKKRFLTACAAGIALVSVVGVGFSAWTFSNNSRVDLNSNVFITHANTFGSFGAAQANYNGTNVSGTACIRLDQPTDSATGISLVSSATESAKAVDTITATWTVSYASYCDTLKDSSATDKIKDSQIEYSVIIYIKTDSLGKYIKLDNTYKDYAQNPEEFHSTIGTHDHKGNGVNGGYSAYKLKLTPSATAPTGTGVQVSISDASSPVTASFTLDAKTIPFIWQTQNEAAGIMGAPTTFGQYGAMVNDLCSSVNSADDVVGGQTYQSTGTPLVIIEFCVYNTAKPTL